jgi:hypothetical protein
MISQRLKCESTGKSVLMRTWISIDVKCPHARMDPATKPHPGSMRMAIEKLCLNLDRSSNFEEGGLTDEIESKASLKLLLRFYSNNMPRLEFDSVNFPDRSNRKIVCGLKLPISYRSSICASLRTRKRSRQKTRRFRKWDIPRLMISSEACPSWHSHQKKRPFIWFLQQQSDWRGRC